MFFIGRSQGKAVFVDPESHLLVLGPPRSGKTTCLVVPNLISHFGPAVVTSTKTDVLDASRGPRGAMGRLWIFDPSGEVPRPLGVEQLRWSYVDRASTLDRSVVVAEQVVDSSLGIQSGSGRHWSERAKAVLAPLLFAASKSHLEIADVVSWVDRRELEEPSTILAAAGEYRALEILSGVLATEARELSAIFSTVSGALASYRSDASSALGVNTNFDPGRFLESRDTIYIVSPSSSQSVAAPVVVGLIDGLREASYQMALAGTTKRPNLALILDEMANIAPLGNLGSILSEGASQGIRLMGCLQDLSQAESRWPASHKGFLTMFGTTVILPGIGDVSTLRTLSYLSGTRSKTEVSLSGAAGRGGGVRVRKSGRSLHMREEIQPVAALGDLASLAKGTAAVFEARTGVSVVDLEPYYLAREGRNLRGR